MRILSEDVFNDVVRECTSKQYLSFCIVMRTAERKRQIKDYFRRNSWHMGLHVHGDVVVFHGSASKIHIVCLANRPTIMYDELIVDDLIADEHAIEVLMRLERQITINDFGEINPSPEIQEYIGGIYGAANNTNIAQSD